MLILWLRNNWKAIAVFIAALATFWGGWHSHTVWSDYRAKKALESQLAAAKEVPVKIIRETQTITKLVNHEVPTDCTHKPIPADIVEQLRK